MPKSKLSPTKLSLDSLEDPGGRFQLGDLLGQGGCGDVYVATDSDAGTVISTKRMSIRQVFIKYLAL